MKIISWNVRALNASDKRQRIRQVIDSLQEDIILLQETKLTKNNFDKIITSWKKWRVYHMQGLGSSRGLAVLWNPLIVNSLLLFQESNWQLIHINAFDISFILINVYGPTSILDKACLWESITHYLQMQDQQRTVIQGDFNALLDQSKKVGGIMPPSKTLQDFNAFVDNNNLMDVHPNNGAFTWTNKRSGFTNIAACLDRFLLYKDWKLTCSNISSDILNLPGSDHFPIFLSFNCNNKCSDQHFHSSFKFESMWLRHPSFLQNIQKWWNEVPLEGQKMHQFAMKLKYIKSQIQIWNQKFFKNVFKKKAIVKDQLEEVYN